jgi:hypothetical protein
MLVRIGGQKLDLLGGAALFDAVARHRFNHSGTRIPVRNSRQEMRPKETSGMRLHILQTDVSTLKVDIFLMRIRDSK